MKNLLMIALLFLSGTSCIAKVKHHGQSGKVKFKVQQIFSGLEIPWGLDFLPDGRQVLVTERKGILSIIDLKTKKKKIIKGLPSVWGRGQGGLLDVRVHPNFDKNHWVYITYSEDHKLGATTVLARFKIEGDQVKNFSRLLVAKSHTNTSIHFGSRIAFDEKGHVFFTVGDRGDRPNGQNLFTHAGSVIRLKQDGSLPADNPFINSKRSLPEIWSYGHRNPQGLFYDRSQDKLWLIEHGPKGGDEINLITKAKNYGWPEISYGEEYWGPVPVGTTHKEGMEQPVYYYIPSIAPSGLIVYSGKAFPAWKGHLFTGALAGTHLNRIELKGAEFFKEHRLLQELGMRVRVVREGPRGHLIIGTDRGVLLELSPGS